MKITSLIIDGTTSWKKTFYEFSLFVPGTVRHFGLFQIDTASADNIKKLFAINSTNQKYWFKSFQRF